MLEHLSTLDTSARELVSSNELYSTLEIYKNKITGSIAASGLAGELCVSGGVYDPRRHAVILIVRGEHSSIMKFFSKGYSDLLRDIVKETSNEQRQFFFIGFEANEKM